MKAFTFQAPPNILFEAGASRKLAELVAGYGVTRVLIDELREKLKQVEEPAE